MPYIFISTMAFFPKALLSEFAMRPVDISLGSYIHQLVYPWSNVIIYLWFLPTLFIIFMIVVFGARLLKKLRKTLYVDILFLVILFGLHIFNPLKNVAFLNLGGVVSYLFYFAIGYYVCKYHIIDYMDKSPLVLSIVISFILSFVYVGILPDFIGKDVLVALNGIIMSIFIGKAYIFNNWHFFDHLNGASYTIYLFSWFPQVASLQILLKFTDAPIIVGSILAFILGVYFPLLIYKLIMRYRTTRIGRCMAFLTGL